MTAQSATLGTQPGSRWKSVGAVALGLGAVIVLSLGTDQVFHSLGVYPPWGEDMAEPLYLLALGYRVVYQIFGCWLTARFAPRNPMKHAWIVGFIGLGLGTLGAIGSIMQSLGPAWYAIALAASALPCAWIGGKLHARKRIFQTCRRTAWRVGRE
jgi:hypothetical protein